MSANDSQTVRAASSASNGTSPCVVVFGEVLIDCFPDGSTVLGGAPFNVAWHLRGLGASPLFISRVGSDAHGRQIHSAMEAWGLKTSGLQIDPERPTGTVEVRLQEGQPTFTILPDQAYDFIDGDQLPPVPEQATTVAHGSLALRRPESRTALDSLLRETGLATVFDVNLRPPWWEAETVVRYLRQAEIVKLAEDELARLSDPTASLGKQVERVLDLGPELVCVTRGARGAIVYARTGKVAESVPDRGGPVVDTVGAGDAFASVFILGRLRGWSIGTVTRRAVDFASAIIERRGATVNDPSFYRDFLETWGRSEC